VTFTLRGASVMRTFGMGLTMQAMLSGANFIVGLLLLRRTNDLQYSYYVLVSGAVLLLTSLQTSFVQPYIVMGITDLGRDERRGLVGGLVRARRRWLPALCATAMVGALGLGALRVLDAEQTLLVLIAFLVGALAMNREFFRTTLFAYRRPLEVLHGDVLYVLLLVAGAWIATRTAQPAAITVAAIGVAALAAGFVLRHGLWRYESWDSHSSQHVLKRLWATGAWALTGAGIHWLLIQGYSYLVAAMLDVRSVAALAATRLTLMPVFVLSGGVSMLLFPMTSRWVRDLGTAAAARRLSLLVAGLLLMALCYMGAMWLLRDWIFNVVLKKHFARRDVLLLLWSAVFLVTLCRDQLATLPAACERFRSMSMNTGMSALVWLVASYIAIQRLGAAGAVVGILVGELTNIVGIVAIMIEESRVPVRAV